MKDNSLVVKKLKLGKNEGKIPTSLVSLAPEKIIVNGSIDVLVGLFHIMWEDMPRRRTYRLRLQDLVSSSGDYSGAGLICGASMKDILRELE